MSFAVDNCRSKLTVVSAEIPICLACGLCCDGTLFDHARLVPEEIEPAAVQGFEIEQFGDEPGFRQPCVQLNGVLCGIYDNRPAVCRKYRCQTLKALDEGRIDRLEASSRVAQARAAADRVHYFGFSSIAEARANAESGPPHLKMALAVLDLLLDRHFRTARQRRLAQHESATET